MAYRRAFPGTARATRATVAAGVSGFLLSWSAPTLDESGAAITPSGYIVYASQDVEDPTDAGISTDTGSTATSYLWSNVALNTGTWYGWVRAYKDYGSGQIAYSLLTSLGQIAP